MEAKYYIGKSNIHGIGIIANQEFKANEIVGVGIEYVFYFIPEVTPLFGSYINHSYTPNCRLVYINNKYYVVANSKIDQYSEITVNYNDGPWFIDRAAPWYK